jgi:hypothetical protein
MPAELPVVEVDRSLGEVATAPARSILNPHSGKVNPFRRRPIHLSEWAFKSLEHSRVLN